MDVRTAKKGILLYGRWLLAGTVSVGLLSWLAYRISLDELARAAAALNWPLLVGLTIGLVLALYGWDVLCVRWLFGQPLGGLSIRTAGGARAASYLWSAFNYEAGQGVMAWRLAQAQEQSLLASLSRCFLLMLHDLAVLLMLALAGSLVYPFPRTTLIPAALGSGLGVLATVIIAWRFLSEERRQRIRQTRWGLWLAWWTWSHSGRLLLWRTAYYMIILMYAALALRTVGINLEPGAICGVVPMVMLADSLPSVSGLGTREMTLLALLDLTISEQAVVSSMSLIWTTGLMLGRAGIGLTHTMVAPWMNPPTQKHSGDSKSESQVLIDRLARDTFDENAGDGSDRTLGQPLVEGTAVPR